ncbi:MAG: hypothetical protein NT121_08060 [Chloroflexi bacterium]|nr:hypothetical protein [Chloroflexota bacterium]
MRLREKTTIITGGGSGIGLSPAAAAEAGGQLPKDSPLKAHEWCFVKLTGILPAERWPR